MARAALPRSCFLLCYLSGLARHKYRMQLLRPFFPRNALPPPARDRAAQQARAWAEAAFSDPALSTRQNVPDTHLVGVYLPFCLPAAVPLLQVRGWREERHCIGQEKGCGEAARDPESYWIRDTILVAAQVRLSRCCVLRCCGGMI